MSKYQVTIQFKMDEQFMGHIPQHRFLINKWINNGILDSYAVSLENRRSWMTFNADSEAEVEGLLRLSPLYPYWTYEIDSIFVYDSPLYRFPKVVLN
jgi:hypothetical protein